MYDIRRHYAIIITSGRAQNNKIIERLIAAAAAVDIRIAADIFKATKRPTTFMFNTMIRACSQTSRHKKSLTLYAKMGRHGISSNRWTAPFVLRSCAALGLFELGRAVHGHAMKIGVESDVYVVNNGITLYSVAGDMKSAQKMFDENTPVLDVVSWTALVTGYSNCGLLERARWLFDQMPSRNLVSWNSIIGGYARAGRVEDAWKLFDGMPERNVASWSSMISGFAQAGRCEEALEVFRMMVQENVELNGPMLVSVLSACAQLRDLEQGLRVHEYIKEHDVPMSVILGTVLVDMYGKCGCIDRAIEVFKGLPEKNIYSWNSLIAGLAMNGAAQQALTLFWKMLLVGLQPNDITFSGLLSACSHSGLVDEGQQLFDMMIRTYGIRPLEQHYGCMVDLFGRAGLLKEAVDFVKNMPVEPHVGLWGALAGACRIHGNVELGEKVAKQLIELEPEYGGRYILLSNIYGAATRWDDLAMVRKLLKLRKANNDTGRSVLDAIPATNF